MRWILAPFAWLYDAVTACRNYLYDKKLLSAYQAPYKTICVGNLSVGGTGKTPHVAYLAELLHSAGINNIAILSRGYKRKTKGYVLADEKASSTSIGDEPFQQHQNLPFASVAVDESRCDGLIHLQQDVENLDIVLLDDAFQHRSVTAGLNILLTPYDHIFAKDHLLPWGNLRENRWGAKRADIIVVTKCPLDISEEQKSSIISSIRYYNKREIYFSSIVYGYLKPVFPEMVSSEVSKSIDSIDGDANGLKALVVTGIAKPEPMYAYLKKQNYTLKIIKFSDHYCFSEKDFVSLQNEMSKGAYDILITTEKDAARMKTDEAFPADLKAKVYALPIQVSFGSDKEKFNQKILHYVG